MKTKNYLKMGKIFFAALTMTSSLAFAQEGTAGGGGGSVEASRFSQAARLGVSAFLKNPKYKQYAEQLNETLNSVEIHVVSNLSNYCTSSSEVNPSTLYARSCPGHIYLSDRYWSENYRGYTKSGIVYYGERWLITDYAANEHLKDILHEVFRAGNPNSKLYVTNDSGYSVTSKMFSEINYNDTRLTMNCDGITGNCSLPFNDEVIDVGYSCDMYSDGGTDLQAKIIGASGQTRSIKIGGKYPNNGVCQNIVKDLNKLDYKKVLIGKSYWCSTYASEQTAALYITVVSPDLSYFRAQVQDEVPTAECLELAEIKSARNQ